VLVEFAHNLQQAVEAAFGKAVLTAAGCGKSGDPLGPTQYCALAVDVCPPFIEGEITSNLCFKLPKLLSDLKILPSEKYHDPLETAAVIAERFSKVHFEIVVGGSGHLNAVTKPGSRREFIERLCQLGGKRLFSGESLLGISEPQVQRSLPEQTFSLQSNFSQTVSRLAEQSDETIAAVLAEYENDPSPDLRILLLSLAADPEIDGTVFLRGLSGRQNTPWYLARYFSDAKRFIDSLPRTESVVEPERRELAATSQLLFLFRHELFMAERMQRPERFFLHVLRLVRDFYRLFNDPRMRSGDERFVPRALRDLELLRAELISHSLERLFGPDASGYGLSSLE